MASVLVIEDDRATAEEIAIELIGRGHEVRVASGGDEGFALAMGGRYDVITLDRMLPGQDGLALVRRLRERAVNTPVLMLSALSDVDERIAGLRAGGDDYLTKPFAPDEMSTRVETLLRRSGGPDPEPTVLRGGGIEVDLVRRRVLSGGAEVSLLNMEFRLLELLLRNRGEVLSRRLIFERVWGYYFDPGANLINVHMARLRKKLDRPGTPAPIQTVKGTGYRFDASE